MKHFFNKCILSVGLGVSFIGAEQQIENMVIIGSGMSGLSAAIYSAREGFDPLIIEGDMPGGMLASAGPLENFPGQLHGIGADLIRSMREHVLTYGAHFLNATVVEVDFQQRPFTIKTSAGHEIKTHTVIVATGSLPRRLNCPGENEYWGKGIVVCVLCDGPSYANRPIAIYGSGDTALGRALFMLQYTKDITVVYHSAELTGSTYFRKKIAEHPEIKLIPSTVIEEINGDGQKVTGLTLKNVITDTRSYLSTQAVFISIGLNRCSDIFKDKLAMHQEDNSICVHNYTRTSVDGVFVAGNVADHGYWPALTAAGTGCMAAVDATDYLADVLGKERVLMQEDCWCHCS